MKAHIQYLIPAVEVVHGSVSVVDVPVEDQDASITYGEGVLGGYGGVVEEAEPHRTIAFGMVTGWAYGAEC